ncbi:MAG: cyclodeaminase/cyclohydrolase family protein [Oscillospiraceae bacterium]|nr:cyclodeaminase/cyclohydrolase family protein [Oscillospiraceae bacterium]
MYKDMTLTEFLEAVSSEKAEPGGGGVAAFVAALGASLSRMVINLTVSKKEYEDVKAELNSINESLCDLSSQYLNDITKDDMAFKDFLDCLSLPKSNEEEKALRSEKMQSALKNAAKVPFELGKKAYDTMGFIEKVIEKGNKQVITDGMISAMLIRCAVLSAFLNVKINLKSIKDKDFVNDLKEKIEYMEKDIIEREKNILNVNF